MEVGAGQVPRNTGKMRVMREEQDLRLCRQFGQHLEPGMGAVVIEIDEQVVGEERKPNARGDRLLGGGEA